MRHVLQADANVAQVVVGPEGGKAFLSTDGSTVYVAAFCHDDANPEKMTEHLSEELARIDGVTTGGIGPAFQQVGEQIEKDLVKAELIAFPLLCIVALWSSASRSTRSRHRTASSSRNSASARRLRC